MTSQDHKYSTSQPCKYMNIYLQINQMLIIFSLTLLYRMSVMVPTTCEHFVIMRSGVREPHKTGRCPYHPRTQLGVAEVCQTSYLEVDSQESFRFLSSAENTSELADPWWGLALSLTVTGNLVRGITPACQIVCFFYGLT